MVHYKLVFQKTLGFRFVCVTSVAGSELCKQDRIRIYALQTFVSRSKRMAAKCNTQQCFLTASVLDSSKRQQRAVRGHRKQLCRRPPTTCVHHCHSMVCTAGAERRECTLCRALCTLSTDPPPVCTLGGQRPTLSRAEQSAESEHYAVHCALLAPTSCCCPPVCNSCALHYTSEHFAPVHS